jgi:hypothetical protein
MILCGGLIVGLDEEMPLATEQLSRQLGSGGNVLGFCCFGEQGMDDSGRAIHANLSVGCLLFSRRRRQKKGSEELKQEKQALVEAWKQRQTVRTTGSASGKSRQSGRSHRVSDSRPRRSLGVADHRHMPVSGMI